MATPSSGQIIGYVSGAVFEGVEPRRSAGDRLLMPVAALAAGATIVDLVANGGRGMGRLVTVLLLVIGLVVVIQDRLTASGRRAAGGRAPAARDVPVRRWRLRPVTGGEITCVQYGDPSAGGLRHGDVICVTGRRSHRGDFVARDIEVLASPGGPVVRVLRGRRAAALLASPGWNRLCYALSAVLAGWVIVVVIGLVA